MTNSFGIAEEECRIANNLDIGVVWGNRNYLTWDVPVQDTLERYRRIYGVTRADVRKMTIPGG